MEGLGDVRRAKRASRRVAAAALANGWRPAVVGLAEVPAVLASSTRIVLCGGDGLVHRAVQMTAGSTVEVAVVPVGTGNDLAGALGIGGAPAVALAASAEGGARVRSLDLIATVRADGSPGPYATSVLTAGYSGRVNATANSLRFPPGGAKYTVAALLEIGRLRPRRMRLTLQLPDGRCEVIDRPTTLVAVGNTSRFGGGMEICPDADPADGLLDVVAVGELGRLDLVRWLPKVFRGTHVRHPAVATFTASSVTLEGDDDVWADGEHVAAGGAPLRVRTAASALRLVVP